MRDYVREKYGILIADGLGKLKGKVIRIGHMGKNFRPTDIMALLYGIREILSKNGKTM